MTREEFAYRILKQAEFHLRNEMCTIIRDHELARNVIETDGRMRVEISDEISMDGVLRDINVEVVFESLPGRFLTIAAAKVPRLARVDTVDSLLELQLTLFAARVMDGLYAE